MNKTSKSFRPIPQWETWKLYKGYKPSAVVDGDSDASEKLINYYHNLKPISAWEAWKKGHGYIHPAERESALEAKRERLQNRLDDLRAEIRGLEDDMDMIQCDLDEIENELSQYQAVQS